MNLAKYLDVAPEVAQAVAAGKPVVALESTIISHGMPYPQNVKTALEVEQIIRDNGAVPATIAILGGRLKAGLTPEEIEYLGKQGQAVTKASRRDLAVLCAERDWLLLVDEVQTGIGRTGTLFAFQQYGILPDAVSFAKGIAGGLPMGGFLVSEKCRDVLGPGDHGSTFGGSPAVCAGALSILGRIDEALLAQVRAKSEYLFSAFEGRPGIEQVSGLGLMIGIRTAKPAAEVVAKCMEQGVLVLTAHGKVRLLPALNIPMELVKKAAEVIIAACA